MNASKILLCCLTISLCGCASVFTLHPLATKESVTFDEKLLGTWVEEDGDSDLSWEFKRLDDLTSDDWLPDGLEEVQNKLYRLNVADKDGRKGSLVACLVKLEDRLFVDVFPDKFPSGEHDAEEMKLPYNAFLFAPLHAFARVDSIGEKLKVAVTGDDCEELLKAEPPVVKVEWLDDTPIVTASTKELQAFLLKHAKNEQLFPQELVLIPKRQLTTSPAQQ